jgi:hypothetical protein
MLANGKYAARMMPFSLILKFVDGNFSAESGNFIYEKLI